MAEKRIRLLVALLLLAAPVGCGRAARHETAPARTVAAQTVAAQTVAAPSVPERVEEQPVETEDPVDPIDADWKERLTPLQYEVTRLKGTERPGTGAYLHTKDAGTYRCVCCGLELFDSESKYDSGCGWPSFYEATAGENVAEHRDTSLGMLRTEITCRRCGAHLGHVFPDGPKPTGRRFCVNSASLRLEPESSEQSETDEDPER